VTYLDLDARGRARWEAEVPADAKALLYVVSGRVKVGDVEVGAGHAALPEPGELSVRTAGPARFAFLAGASHREPIRQHGPYVD
jgi:redox-sensitive bicupin YhaK (pirin superfamily)